MNGTSEDAKADDSELPWIIRQPPYVLVALAIVGIAASFVHLVNGMTTVVTNDPVCCAVDDEELKRGLLGYETEVTRNAGTWFLQGVDHALNFESMTVYVMSSGDRWLCARSAQSCLVLER